MTGSTRGVWDRRRLEATVQAAALCAYVDGHLAEEEREHLSECVAIFAASEPEAVELLSLVRELPEWTKKRESGYLAAQLAEIKEVLGSEEERQHAFRLAARVAAAHRGIGVGETAFLVRLMDELEVEGTFAKRTLAELRVERRAPRYS